MDLGKNHVWEGIISHKMKEDKRKQVEREKASSFLTTSSEAGGCSWARWGAPGRGSILYESRCRGQSRSPDAYRIDTERSRGPAELPRPTGFPDPVS